MNCDMQNRHLPDLGTKQLSAVLAVAEHRSFIAAASHLQMSQPALTRIIKRVEDVLGTRLFDRTTRIVELTNAGREFLPIAQRITDEIRMAAENLRGIADQQRGQVIVSCIMSIANNVLPSAVSAYRDAHPGIEIRLHDGIHGTIMEDVRSGAADFGLSYLQDVPSGVETVHLGRGSFDLVVRSENGLSHAKKGSIAFDALAHLNLISLPLGSETRRVLDATAATRGKRLNHAVTVTHIPTLLSFVRAGVGVAVVPSTSVMGLLGDDLKRLNICEPEIALDIGVVKNAERELSPAAVGLLQFIRDAWPTH